MRHSVEEHSESARVLRHPVDVAEDMASILKFTPYIYRISLGTDGTYVEVGDAGKKKMVQVRIENHRDNNNSWLQDKLLVVKLTTRLINQLRKQ